MAHRIRQLIMDDFDNAMLSYALLDAFPSALFCKRGRPLPRPQLETRPTIVEAGSTVEICVPDEGWQPAFEPFEKASEGFRLLNPPAKVLFYSGPRWFWGEGRETAKWSFSLPTPEHAQIDAFYDPDDPEQRAFVRKVWKLLERLTTNKLKGAWRGRSERLLMSQCKYGEFWAGPHVLEWCQQAPDRMLMGSRLPCDDWRFPDDPWTQDLRRRVEERFGRDFGGPTPPPWA